MKDVTSLPFACPPHHGKSSGLYFLGRKAPVNLKATGLLSCKSFAHYYEDQLL